MNDIWAIVLAAGESRRMGIPKMLLPFDRSTMLETVITHIINSKINRLLVVLGAEKDAICQKIGKMNLTCCYNEYYKEGMLSSVKCGFRNLPSDFKAAMVFQGDQPLIETNTINTMAEAYLSSNNGIVIPVFKKKRGHPIVIDRKYRNEIEKLNPEIGLRELTLSFSNDILECNTEDPGILRDFDTYKEYLEAINLIQ
jgi:molybdenum cofactor cytidylyltransferase